MKLWTRADEWVQFASCQGDERFISENPSHDEKLRVICGGCRVRPECIKWAVQDEVSSVFVAGVRLPDPALKRNLRVAHNTLRESIPGELERRGEDV